MICAEAVGKSALSIIRFNTLAGTRSPKSWFKVAVNVCICIFIDKYGSTRFFYSLYFSTFLLNHQPWWMMLLLV